MIIRSETPADHQAIHDVTEAAFASMAFADGTEASAIGQMRDAGELFLSLVAEDDQVIGHVAFSDAKLATPGRWAGLGPIAVQAHRQRQGVGTKLVEAGLTQLQALGYDGCVLIGSPEVYGPMGFVSGGVSYRGLADEIVQYRSLTGRNPSGEILFCPTLEAL